MFLVWAIRYFWLTVRHKTFMIRAGVLVGCSIWRIITHDLSKFSSAEVFSYGRQFFGDKGDPEGFAKAWLHHQNSNDHHWEYWIPRTVHNRSVMGFKENHPLPMSEEAIREMIADWIAASRTYGGHWPRFDGSWLWFNKNFHRMRLHPKTRDRIWEILNDLRYISIGLSDETFDLS
jgi:hypothetical protein